MMMKLITYCGLFLLGVAYLRLRKLSTLIMALLIFGGTGALMRVLTAFVLELLLLSYWLTLWWFEDEASCGRTLIGLDFIWFTRESSEDFRRTLRDDFLQKG